MNKRQSDYFSPRHILKRYIVDNLIQRAFFKIPIIQLKGNEEYIKEIEKVFELDNVKNIIINKLITFDETMWLPSDKTSYRNIVKIEFQISGNLEYTQLTLDLRKNIDDYANSL